MSVLARFGDHNCIACQQIDILWTVQMLTKEHPKQDGPREYRGEKALHGPITAPFVGPPGKAQHGDAPRHDQQGRSKPAEVAAGRRRYMRLQALYTC